MPQVTPETQAEPKTCADCPFYQSRQDGTDKGWCGLFNAFARESHLTTQDCVNEIAVQEVDEQAVSQPKEITPKQPAVGSGSLTFKQALSANPNKTVYEVFCGADSLGIVVRDRLGVWYNSCYSHTNNYATPYEAAAALIKSTNLDMPATPEIEVDSDTDPDFGELYRVWCSTLLLGTFYCAADGKWVAQPCNSDLRSRCNTATEAQLLIVAMSGLLVADTKEYVVDLLDKPFDELTVTDWQVIKREVGLSAPSLPNFRQQAIQAELAA